MTLSIVARCPDTGQFGIAAATGIAGVGKLLTWARPRAGAVATQGRINPYLGIDAIELLDNGHLAPRVMAAALSLDPYRDERQVGLVDASGNPEAWTGPDCEGWAGHLLGDGWSVQGNLLRSSKGADACAEAFEASEGELVHRLMRALQAGCEAGGDRRGERSATVYVMDVEEYPRWDVRVDMAEDPIAQLFRLQAALDEELVSRLGKLPTRTQASGLPGRGSREGVI